MPHDPLTEFPEQRLTQELMRIRTQWQQGAQADHSLEELFEVLVQFGREIDCDPQSLNDHIHRFSEPAEGSRDNQRLSILVAMLRVTQTELRCRVMKLAERFEEHDVVRQANASYGGVAQWGHATPTPPAFRYHS